MHDKRERERERERGQNCMDDVIDEDISNL
jgi:hypothetical protein